MVVLIAALLAFFGIGAISGTFMRKHKQKTAKDMETYEWFQRNKTVMRIVGICLILSSFGLAYVCDDGLPSKEGALLAAENYIKTFSSNPDAVSLSIFDSAFLKKGDEKTFLIWDIRANAKVKLWGQKINVPVVIWVQYDKENGKWVGPRVVYYNAELEKATVVE